jgi:hypothetical protein
MITNMARPAKIVTLGLEGEALKCREKGLTGNHLQVCSI